MKHERAEKQHARHQPKAPYARSGKVELQCIKIGNEREGDESKNQEPAGMQVDRYPENSANLDSFTAHRGTIPRPQYSATFPGNRTAWPQTHCVFRPTAYIFR